MTADTFRPLLDSYAEHVTNGCSGNVKIQKKLKALNTFKTLHITMVGSILEY